MATKKTAKDFKSVSAYKAWVKAAHSIPSDIPGKSVTEASKGNTPVKVRGKSYNKKIKH